MPESKTNESQHENRPRVAREFELLFDEYCDNPRVRVASVQARVFPSETVHVREVLPGEITITREQWRKWIYSMRPPVMGCEPPGCHAGGDGDCDWSECPQKRDNEPAKSGRHCPLDAPDEDA